MREFFSRCRAGIHDLQGAQSWAFRRLREPTAPREARPDDKLRDMRG
jgi:hypothetical protein